MPDLTVENHGSIFILRPETDAGTNWCNDHLPDDCPMLGMQYCIEHNFIGDIVQGAINDGLAVQ